MAISVPIDEGELSDDSFDGNYASYEDPLEGSSYGGIYPPIKVNYAIQPKKTKFTLSTLNNLQPKAPKVVPKLWMKPIIPMPAKQSSPTTASLASTSQGSSGTGKYLPPKFSPKIIIDMDSDDMDLDD